MARPSGELRMEEYTKASFDALDDAGKPMLATDLASKLEERLSHAPEFHTGVRVIVDELRRLGHDLWSFDESDDREVWCPNYLTPSGPGIVITFTTEGVEVAWSGSGRSG